jgi:hypothetical protein
MAWRGSCEVLGAGFALLIYLHEQTPLDLSDKARYDCNDFNKTICQLSSDLTTELYALHPFRWNYV